MDAKRFREEYKYVTYFLRELGLLGYWKEYLKFLEKRSRLSKEPTSLSGHNPSIYTSIDKVFGSVNFTAYLEQKGIRFKYRAAIVTWFRAFLLTHTQVEICDDSVHPDYIADMRKYKKMGNFKEIVRKT